MKLRELSGQDTFLLLPILSKLGIADLIRTYKEKREELGEEIREAEEEGKEFTEDDHVLIGIEVVGGVLDHILSNIGKVQNDLNKLLAELTGSTQKEIKELNFAEYNLLVIELFSQDAFKDFFKQLFSSSK